MLFTPSLLSARPQGRASLPKNRERRGPGPHPPSLWKPPVFTKRKCIVKNESIRHSTGNTVAYFSCYDRINTEMGGAQGASPFRKSGHMWEREADYKAYM